MGKLFRDLQLHKDVVYYMAIWSIFRPFGLFFGHLVYFEPLGIFYVHLVYCSAIWYILSHLVYLMVFDIFFPRFGMNQEKSGNPSAETQCAN
jgi:hypothetical protein